LLPWLALLVGGAVSLYCLWQFRRWLGVPQEAVPAASRRLEVLVDELVATAEAASAVVQEKADALTELVAQADRRLHALAAASQAVAGPAVAGPAPAAPVAAVAPAAPAEPIAAAVEAAPAPTAVHPDLHRQVYALADGGHDVTTIARRLGLTKGEVMLILGLRKGGAPC